MLLPVAALSGLTPAQLEAVVAHELAHIRRWDYAVNVIQAAIEAVLFFHPAVRWASRRVREERQNCCDDIAVSVVGDRPLYAEALERLEHLRADAAPPQPALAATGGVQNRAAELIQMPLRTFVTKLKRYAITAADWK